MPQYFQSGGATQRARQRIAARAQAEQARQRAKKKKDDGGFSLGDLVPDIGVGQLFKELGGIPGGLADLATGKGGYGHAWGNFGKGILSSALGTARTINPSDTILNIAHEAIGTPNPYDALADSAGDFLASTDEEAKLGLYKPKHFIQKYNERGLLPSVVEDVGNAAVAGQVAGAATKVGNVGRLANAARLAEEATQAGARSGVSAAETAAQIERAAQVAKEGTGVSKFRSAGIENRLIKQAGKAAAKAEGRVAPAEAIAKRIGTQNVWEGVAHPYRAAFQKALRPLTRASQGGAIADAAGPLDDVAAPTPEGPPPGHTRLYHSEQPVAAGQAVTDPDKMWFSTDPTTGYGDDARYVDVPDAELGSFESNPMWDLETGQQTATHYQVPREHPLTQATQPPSGTSPITQVGETYKASRPDLQLGDTSKLAHTGDYPEQMGALADEYLNGPDLTGTPEMDASYAALEAEVLGRGGQAEHVFGSPQEWVPQPDGSVQTPSGIRLTFNDGDGSLVGGYDDAAQMRADLENNNHLIVRHTESAGDAPNFYMSKPIMQADGVTPVAVPVTLADGTIVQRPLVFNDVFRAVHDVYGHARTNDFGQAGEVTAWRLHDQLFSPEAQTALANETVGQTAAIGANPGSFPPQRAVGLDPATLDSLRNPAGPAEISPRLGPFEQGVRAEALKPVPAWAEKLAAQLPEKVRRGLGRFEGWIEARETSGVRRERERFQEAERRRLFHTPAVQLLVRDAAQEILSRELPDGSAVTPEMASPLIGDEVIARMEGTPLLEAALIMEGADPVEVRRILVESGARNAQQLPHEWLYDEAGDPTQLGTIIDRGVAEWKGLEETRLGHLRGGRLGDRGIADVGSDEIALSQAQKKALRKLGRIQQRAERLTKRIEAERGRAGTAIETAETKTGTLDALVENLQARQAGQVEAVQGLYDYTPPRLAGAAKPAFYDTVLETTATHDGGTFNPSARTAAEAVVTPRKYGGPAQGFGVGIVNGTVKRVPLAEWEANHAAILDEVLSGPYKELLADPDVRIGTWVHDTAEGRVVDIDFSQHTHNGLPLTRDQARILGLSRGQEAIFDFGDAVPEGINPDEAYPDISLSGDSRDQAIASHLREAALRPQSGYSRFARGMRNTTGRLEEAAAAAGTANLLDDTFADAGMDLYARLAWAAQENGRVSSLDDFFGRHAIQYGKDSQNMRPGTLFQTVLNLEPGPALDRALREVKDVEGAMRWYNDSHEALEKRWRFDKGGNERTITLLDGSERPLMDVMYDLIAVTSVMAAPNENLGRALGAVANLREFTAANRNAVATAEKLVKRMLELPTENVRSGNKVGSARLLESFARDLTKGTSMTTTPMYNVMDILHGRLNLAEADTELLRQLPEQWTGKTKALSEKNLPAELVTHWEEQLRLEGLDEAEIPAQARERALMEYHGSAALAKLRSFRDNLARPEASRAVTLDSWMARMLGIPDWAMGNVYDDVAVKLRDAADAYVDATGKPMDPHQLQSLLWVFTKTEIGQQDWGRLMAATDDAAAAIQGGTWTPETDPVAGWHNQTIEPSVEAGRGGQPQEAATDVVRKRQEPGELDSGVRGPETRKFLTKGGDELKAAQGRLEKYETDVQAKIAEKLAEGDTDGALDALFAYARRQRKAALGTEGNAHFGVVQEAAGSKTAIATNLARLDELGEGPTVGAELHQKFQQKVTGSFTPAFATNTGKAITKFFDGSRPDTMVHEMGHLLYYLLNNDELGLLDEHYGGNGHFLRAPGDASRVAVEERFADDLLRYLSAKKAPKGLEGVFVKLKTSLWNLWEAGRQQLFGSRTPEPIQDLFDRWFEPEDVTHLEEVRPELPSPAEGASIRQLANALPEFPNETANEARRRGYRAGLAVARHENLQSQINAAVTRKARLAKGAADIRQTLIEHSLPSELQKAKLEGHVQRGIDRLAKQLETPGNAQVPAQWKPLWGAFKDLHKAAEDSPALAAALEDLPQTWESVLKIAVENGFNPTHVNSIPEGAVRDLVYGQVRLGAHGRMGQDIVAGQRKVRLGNQAMTRSIEALGAGLLQATHESNSNALVSYLEDVVAKPVVNDTIPKGWVPWDPERNFILRGERTESGDLRLAARGAKATKMIPVEVKRTIDGMAKDYSHGIFGGLTKILNPWRALVLTMSPRWYVNNFVGNVLLATVEGVKIRDWVKAWHSYRNSGTTPFSDIPEVTHASLLSDLGGEASMVPYPKGKAGFKMARKAGGVKEATTLALHRLARANEVVDEMARAAVYHRSLRVGKSAEQALQRSFTALVDYGDLGPFERQFVRSVVPFYAWQKGILKLVAKFPIDHPIAAGVGLQFYELNKELNRDQYGGDLPEAYSGFVDLPLLGTVNTRGINPFQDSGSLTTPQGIASSLNPVLDIAIRNAFGAPEGGFATKYRQNEFGQVVPDTSPAEDVQSNVLNLPQFRLGAGVAGQLPEGQPQGVQAAGRFVGANYYTEDQVRKIIERVLKAQKRTGVSS